jgi:acyl carrier protein
MTPIFNESNEAIQDLPTDLQEALKRYDETRADGDLNKVILAAIRDIGPNSISGEITDETNFINDLGLDSLAIAEFVFFFEDVFTIRISNEELSEMRSLGELKAFLKMKLG